MKKTLLAYKKAKPHIMRYHNHDHDPDMSLHDWAEYCIEIASFVYNVDKVDVYLVYLEAYKRNYV